MSAANPDEKEHAVQCHYAVLGVERNADATAIKKAHRKLALQNHPDKGGDEEQFRLVQQAYECLSDPTERQWYDDHREAILKGWSAGDATAAADAGMLFDVEPFMYAGCYRGFEPDTPDNFYAVYQRVFAAVYEGELQGKEFDLDEDDGSSSGLQKDFGTADTAWGQVATFYQTWESFGSCLNFAWADPYDSTQAENRRVRRAMEEENKKARKAAKRARNEEILALVRFVKRRDVRVQARRQQMEQEKLQKEQQRQQDAIRKKKETQQARAQWRQQAEEEMAAAEEQDRLAGRIRLADLEDDYDYGGKKGKKGKKKKNKGRKKTQEEQETKAENETRENSLSDAGGENGDDTNGAGADGNEPTIPGDDEEAEGEAAAAGDDDEANVNTTTDAYEESDISESEESEEPDIWRCECCRKDFKSEGQMENHMRSKKHKEAWKKYQAKLKKLEQQLMEEMLDEQEE